MSFFSSNGTLLLLHKRLDRVRKASKYDLMLSPQFYIVTRQKIPVKYAFQAKKLAPSILDDLLPADDNYEYEVKRDGDSWLFFAYSPKEIEEFLKSCCNIPAHRIGKIYFADQLREVLKKLPIGIDEENALTLVDNLATIVPRSMLQSDRYARFTSKLRPKHSYSFKHTRKRVEDSKVSRTTVVVASLLALLALFFFLDGYGYKRAIAKEEASLDKLYEENPQLRSKLVRESIQEKYEGIEKRERSIRNLLDSFSQLTSKKVILDRVEIKENKMIGRFMVDPKEMKHILSVATAENLKVNRLNPAVVVIEGEIK